MITLLSWENPANSSRNAGYLPGHITEGAYLNQEDGCCLEDMHAEVGEPGEETVVRGVHSQVTEISLASQAREIL